MAKKPVTLGSSAQKSAKVGKYKILVDSDGSVEVYRHNLLGVISIKPMPEREVKGALREIADKIGFKYDPAWTTRQFGSKLIDAVNGK